MKPQTKSLDTIIAEIVADRKPNQQFAEYIKFVFAPRNYVDKIFKPEKK